MRRTHLVIARARCDLPGQNRKCPSKTSAAFAATQWRSPSSAPSTATWAEFGSPVLPAPVRGTPGTLHGNVALRLIVAIMRHGIIRPSSPNVIEGWQSLASGRESYATWGRCTVRTLTSGISVLAETHRHSEVQDSLAGRSPCSPRSSFRYARPPSRQRLAVIKGEMTMISSCTFPVPLGRGDTAAAGSGCFGCGRTSRQERFCCWRRR